MPDKDPNDVDEPREAREEPEVVPAQSAEQPVLGAALGVAAYSPQDPDAPLTGDNDEDSHVSPTDNDGETVPG